MTILLPMEMNIINQTFDRIRFFIQDNYRGVKNLIQWFKIIYNTKYYDYGYSIDVFKKHLEHVAEHLDSDKSHSLEAKNNAKRIRTVVKLMTKVYDEEYAREYQEILANKYGPEKMEFIPSEKHDEYFELVIEYPDQPKEKWEEIGNEKYNLIVESRKKQEKAHKTLWKLVEHSIRNFWD